MNLLLSRNFKYLTLPLLSHSQSRGNLGSAILDYTTRFWADWCPPCWSGIGLCGGVLFWSPYQSSEQWKHLWCHINSSIHHSSTPIHTPRLLRWCTVADQEPGHSKSFLEYCPKYFTISSILNAWSFGNVSTLILCNLRIFSSVKKYLTAIPWEVTGFEPNP